MDSEGYVRLTFISTFNRVKTLTQDLNILRDACFQSPEVQLAAGVDDYLIRKAVGWETWVLSEEERDPSARGVNNWHIDPRQRILPNNAPATPQEMSAAAPPFNPDPRRNRSLSAISVGAPPFVPSGIYSPGVTNGFNYSTPLSADVPEFSPSFMNFNGAPDANQDDFPDSEIDKLMIVVKRGDSKPTSPGTSPSKVRPSAPGLTNGDSGYVASVPMDNILCLFVSRHDSMVSPSTPSFPDTPGDRSINAQGEVGWLLSGDPHSDASSHALPKKFVHKPYDEFRRNALKQREETAKPSKSSDMVTLYQFWSHLLPQKFNSKMYNEFRKFALEDANHLLRSGLENLFNFYERSLKEREHVNDGLIPDLVTLARKDGRNGFEFGPQKLKSVLGNDHLRAHHKQKIEELLDPEVLGFLKNGVEKREGELTELYNVVCC
jgi:la-related protein 1